MLSIRSSLLIIGILVCATSYSQDSIAHIDTKITTRYFDVVSKKALGLNEALDKKSEKTLHRIQKQEAKLKRKLSRIDSLAANNIFSNSAEKFNNLRNKLKDKEGKLTQYIPKLDTIAASLKFLEQNSELIGDLKGAKEKFATK